ncbi:YqfQ family protein [Gracilibacillus caseinilyticus]|uniref:YqfQ family protein n=1 Tax=Gracilibacillus caseinilyticus TaxID=2932256 RepID=A0ABY4ET77_9BACI|nr:YqfQ family protein [Gracilibacillus caseinilyticus]UOQ47631.1 YqfQ family protein [Gracilibacillus caseinilyticus]
MFRPPNQPPQFPMQQMPPGGGGGYFPGFQSRGPMPPMANQAANSQSGLQGLLQRFLPSQASSASQVSNLASSAGAGGGSNLMGTLNNVQQVLKVAQQATPLIKEYGPMIKNAPKLINMMKALSEINDEDDEESTDVAVDAQADEADELNIAGSADDNMQSNANRRRTALKSQPKLFI